jgi:hypothetical protein
VCTFFFNYIKMNDIKVFLDKYVDSERHDEALDVLDKLFNRLNIDIFSKYMDVWEHILYSVNYNDDDNFIITATQIKKCGKTWTGRANQFEPRLLCYQSSSNSRPQIFKKKGIYIFPIKNGTYILTKHNIYEQLVYTDESPCVFINRDTTSIMLNIGDSETTLIDNLRYSGVFERPEILGEKITHGPLLNGRHRISLDEMKLGSGTVSIQGVQYETDSCFESAGKILIIEGKSLAKQIDSFNIRQLYFPYYEAWRLSREQKEIVCLFIHELCGLIRVWKYTFSDPNRIDSIKLLGCYTYKFWPEIL